MDKVNLKKLLSIMGFYIILSYIIAPTIGYYITGNTINGLGNGFVIGSIISIILWYKYGKKIMMK